MNQTNVEIGRRIKKRRTELSMTLEDVASAVKVTRSTIQRYEQGKIQKIKLPVLTSIAKAINADPLWLSCKTDSFSVYYDPTDSNISDADLQVIQQLNSLSPEQKALFCRAIAAEADRLSKQKEK